jgi:AcrR family transcriptional regulator
LLSLHYCDYGVPMNEIASANRRERKKQATYRALREAALRLGLERGVEHVTVEDICTAADIAPRTFSNYFETKDDAFVGTEREAVEGLAESIHARPAGESPLHIVQAVLKQRAERSPAAAVVADPAAQLRLVAENPSLLPRQMARFAAVERLIGEGIARRLAPDQAPRAELVGALAGTVMRLATQHWLQTPQRPLAELVEEAFQALRRELNPDTEQAHPHARP